MKSLVKNNIEFYLFIVLIALNCLPLFVSSNFVTLEGGAHCYNANIIHQLIFNSGSVYETYYEFNPNVVSYWSVHVLLVLFKLILPFSLAEKLLVLIYFVVTPFFFRKIVLTYNKDNAILSYLIFPFTHFLILYLGQFNFCFGIMFCFMGMFYWTRCLENKTIKQWVIMLMVCILTFFSHVFPFIILVLYCLSESFFKLASTRDVSPKVFWKTFLCPVLLLIALLSPLVYLAKNYLFNLPTYGKEFFIEKKELMKQVYHAQPLQVYSDSEMVYTRLTFIVIVCSILFFVLMLFLKYIKNSKSFKLDLRKNQFLFLGAALCLLLFIAPDNDMQEGAMSSHLILFMFYFFVFWIAILETHKNIKIAIVAILLIIQVPLMIARIKGITWANGNYAKMEDFSDKMDPNSTVIPLFFDDTNWLGRNLSNYLGAEKDIVVLDNFEASVEYYPLVWKNDNVPSFLIGNINMWGTCVSWKSNPYNPETRVADYVFVIGQKAGDACYESTLKMLSEKMEIKHKREDVVLYKLKTQSSAFVSPSGAVLKTKNGI